MPEPMLTRYLQPLLAGRRSECFQIIHDALTLGASAEQMIADVLWPAMAQIDRLYRDDRINLATEHMACRINRTLADQLQARLNRAPARGKRLLVACADGAGEELGAQMVADLFEADGWEVFFVGGGVPDDEILTLIGQLRPHAFILFGTRPEAVPDARRLIELIREVAACPTMNTIVSGGVFNRADGLWSEIGADLFAPDARSLVASVNALGPRSSSAPRTSVVKKRRRQRKPALAGAT